MSKANRDVPSYRAAGPTFASPVNSKITHTRTCHSFSDILTPEQERKENVKDDTMEFTMEELGDALEKCTPLTFYDFDYDERREKEKANDEENDYYLIMNGLLELQLLNDPALEAFADNEAVTVEHPSADDRRDDTGTKRPSSPPTVKRADGAKATVFSPIKSAPTKQSTVVVSPKANRQIGPVSKTTPRYMPVDNTFVTPPISMTPHPNSKRKNRGVSFSVYTHPHTTNQLNFDKKYSSSTSFYDKMTAFSTPTMTRYLSHDQGEAKTSQGVPKEWIELYHDRPSTADGQATVFAWMREILSMRKESPTFTGAPLKCDDDSIGPLEGRTCDLGLNEL